MDRWELKFPKEVDQWSGHSCAWKQTWGQCHEFRRQCERTCGVCQVETPLPEPQPSENREEPSDQGEEPSDHKEETTNQHKEQSKHQKEPLKEEKETFPQREELSNQREESSKQQAESSMPMQLEEPSQQQEEARQIGSPPGLDSTEQGEIEEASDRQEEEGELESPLSQRRARSATGQPPVARTHSEVLARYLADREASAGRVNGLLSSLAVVPSASHQGSIESKRKEARSGRGGERRSSEIKRQQGRTEIRREQGSAESRGEQVTIDDSYEGPQSEEAPISRSPARASRQDYVRGDENAVVSSGSECGIPTAYPAVTSRFSIGLMQQVHSEEEGKRMSEAT